MSDLPFKTNFTDLRAETGSVQENYDYPSNVRNVVFMFSNGDEAMRNYACLVSVDLYRNGEMNFLEVGFTSDTILIEGYRLSLLRDKFFHYMPRIIMPRDSRYFSESNETYFIVSVRQGLNAKKSETMAKPNCQINMRMKDIRQFFCKGKLV